MMTLGVDRVSYYCCYHWLDVVIHVLPYLVANFTAKLNSTNRIRNMKSIFTIEAVLNI